MAIYHAQMESLSRSDGRSAVAAAAYRAGVRLEDERTGLVYDYRRKGGVMVAEILTPDGGPADRSELWNAVEAAERRKDSRTGREWVLALPAELDAEQRRDLARGFALELVRRYGVAVDMAIHEPSREGDERNHHAHLFATTRTVSRSESGALVLGEKATIELSDSKRKAVQQQTGVKLKSAADEVTELRQLWERLANEALERAGRAERIDSRSLEDQGSDRNPTIHLGPAATAMERRKRAAPEPKKPEQSASRLGEINRQAEARNAEREAVQAEIIDLKAERDRRAKEAEEAQAAALQAAREAQAAEEARLAEDARQTALKAAQALKEQEAARRRAERERIKRMSVPELAQEVRRLRPPAVKDLVREDEAVQSARSRQKAVEERASLAAQEIQAWRDSHPVWSWLHDRFFRSGKLKAKERELAEAKREAEASVRSLETILKEATDRITEAQRPARERFEALEQLHAQKEREEAQAAFAKEQERIKQRWRARSAVDGILVKLEPQLKEYWSRAWPRIGPFTREQRVQTAREEAGGQILEWAQQRILKSYGSEALPADIQDELSRKLAQAFDRICVAPSPRKPEPKLKPRLALKKELTPSEPPPRPSPTVQPEKSNDAEKPPPPPSWSSGPSF